MKKRILIAAGILAVVCAVGAGGWYYMKNRGNTAAEGETAYVSTINSIMGISSGISNRYAGVVEPQETLEIEIESGRKVTEVEVKVGDVVTQGQLLFEYNLSSIQEELQTAKLELDRLKNEAVSLKSQIATLEKEKKQADKDSQLSYTIEIETNKMNLRKNEYDQASKEASIQKLQNATGNTEVRSEINGIIQKIDTSKLSYEDGDSLDESGMDMNAYYSGGMGGQQSNAFITILSTGAYRVKGTANEQNLQEVMSMEGTPVLIRSRVDEDQVWKGTMGAVDQQNATAENNAGMYYGMMDSSGDSQTSSSTYPFYVSLETSEGLMLGQHVYIERDDGQGEQKKGLWLSDYYIVDADKENPYVWAADKENRLEKRFVILGKHDEALAQYEIVDGLSASDSIAFPVEDLKEGMEAIQGDGMMMENPGTDEELPDMEPGGELPDLETGGGEAVTEPVGEMAPGEEGMDVGAVEEGMTSDEMAGAEIIEEGIEDVPMQEGLESPVDLDSMEGFDADMGAIGQAIDMG